MFKKFRVVAVALVVTFALTLAVGGLFAAEDKVPDISTIMKTSFGKGGIQGKLKTAAKGENWDDVKKLAVEFKAHGESLSKNKCPKGDAESWTKLTAKFKDATAAVSDAADKKDAKALAASLGKLNCKECHDAHK